MSNLRSNLRFSTYNISETIICSLINENNNLKSEMIKLKNEIQKLNQQHFRMNQMLGEFQSSPKNQLKINQTKDIRYSCLFYEE